MQPNLATLRAIPCLLLLACSRPAPENAVEPPGATNPSVEAVAAEPPEEVAGTLAVEPPQVEEPDTVAQQGERGVTEALNAIEEGRVQTLYIGEPGPMDYVDPSSGLPGDSMGCEWDEETDAYVREYNATVIGWWTDAAPFADDAVITFRRRGAGENLVVHVGRNEVLVAHGAGIPQPVDSGFDERLSIAAWVTRAEAPGPEADGLGTPFDSIEWRGWTTRWQLEAPAPVDARAIRLFEELAGRPR